MNNTQSSQPYPRIIGLAGTFASGKDTLANYLTKYDHYVHFSTSDMVRAEASRLYGSTERPILMKTANESRHEHGAGIFAVQALNLAGKRNVIVSGLRSLGEMNEVRQAGGVIVFVDAPIEVRYERMKQRQRDEEVSLSLEEFGRNEQKEWHAGNDLADFNLGAIKQKADIIIENDLTLEAFLKQAKHELAQWQSAHI